MRLSLWEGKCKMKVLVSEKIAQKGVDILNEAGLEVDFRPTITRDELLAVVGSYDALVVRSATKVNEELFKKAVNLKVVGRAGNGVDNIEMNGATKRGIIVVNTPEANTVSTAEHTISLLLSCNRHIPQANAMVKSKEWDRSRFKGVELSGKTLGIIGLGRIGSLVSQRMRAFGMKVIAYDPYISDERFERFGVEKKEKLEDLMREVDALTVHTPKTAETMGMVGKNEFALAKKGILVVNCARGGIIEEQALYEAVQAGIVTAAAIDVLKDEPKLISPLLDCENVIFTPHLGADTYEAQDNVGATVAREVLSALEGGVVPNAVNMPSMGTDNLDGIYPYLQLAEKLGNLYYGLSKSAIKQVNVQFGGEAAAFNSTTIVLALLKGLFEPVMMGRVNYVNAGVVAEERGVETAVLSPDNEEKYNNILRVTVYSQDGKEHRFAGLVSGKDSPRIVEINGYPLDILPASNMMILLNHDRPGLIGKVGTVLGGYGVNITTMQYGSLEDKALMVLSLDREVGDEQLEKLREIDGILKASFVQLY